MLPFHVEGVLPDLPGNRAYLLIDIGEHIGQVAFDHADEHFLDGFCDFF